MCPLPRAGSVALVVTSGPASDAARRLVVERDLVRTAFQHLTVDAFMTLPFEALAPTKTLLKRFFSTDPWGPADDDRLAAVVGPGEGAWRRDLDDDLALEYGWNGGRFGLRVVSTAIPTSAEARSAAPPRRPSVAGDLAATFDGPVVPEATPNPRTLRFHVGSIHDGPSRWYESPADAAGDDPGAARLFGAFTEVANVLVGPDFVAVGLDRPADWERLLRPILDVVTEEFTSPETDGRDDAPRVMGGPAGAGATAGVGGEGVSGAVRRLTRLQQAWRDLGTLRPGDDSDDLARVRAASASGDPSHRQVAASLLREADAAPAGDDWARLVADPVRSVRRAAVDAMVDVGRQELRPLLEAALADTDAWVRWKALRGLAELGAAPSRGAISACGEDPDFRVRLEVAAALRSAG